MKRMQSRCLRMIWPAAAMLYLFTVADATRALANAADESHWMLSLGQTDYVLDSHGSVLDGEGAHVGLTASPGRTAPMGSSIASVSAAAYRGHSVKLSGLISTTDARHGAGLWLRADGPQGRLAFANSQASLVVGNASAQQREVEIPVPPSATTLVFGTLLFGDGQSSVDHLSLRSGDAISLTGIVPADKELEAAIEIVKEHALRSSSLDWNTLLPKLRAQTDKSGWSLDAYPPIRELLGALQDHHSHLLAAEEARATRSPETTVVLPVVEPQQGDFGYIALLGFNSTEPHHVASYVEAASSGMAQIAGSAASGWILDLRNDEGGNMWPMLAALRPFLGDAPLGYFKGRDGLSTSWKAQLDQLHPMASSVNLSAAPLAVLTGPHTASAGEAVIIALKGRPHTRFFGLPTAGVPTGNRAFKLPDGAEIALATTVELDRAQMEYDGPIAPDVAVAPDAAIHADSDGALLAAKLWLHEVASADCCIQNP
ncbi:S41 family peptidase [Dyella amyloliquefaciens]|uniref:S41 family peptidase n=1 Tax=Dyella amyloliquefaciens TaxID=1770545 RepID=UPI00102E6D71|nr:S41 family peptidase [Dyella amyloliquefaciens]